MSVVRIRRSGGKIVQWCDIYVGRSCSMGGWNLPTSKWANPFTVKQYGLPEALIKYEQYVRSNLSLWNSLEELDGKVLGCWCLNDIVSKERINEDKKIEVCHAQVLLRLLEEKKSK